MVLNMHIEMHACQGGFGMLSMVRCFAWFDPGRQIFILRAYAYDGTTLIYSEAFVVKWYINDLFACIVRLCGKEISGDDSFASTATC